MVEKWFMYHSQQMTLLSPCEEEKDRERLPFVKLPHWGLKRFLQIIVAVKSLYLIKVKKEIIESYVMSNLISNITLMQ